MSEAVFQAPKRRARVYEAYETPFPVPLSHEDAIYQGERVYRAELVNHHIVVRDPRHIHCLYSKGYFGKGIFSRARPDHSISDRWEQTRGSHFPVLSHSKYQQRVNWARDVLLTQGLEEEAVNQTLQRLCQPVELQEKKEGTGGGENGHRRNPHSGEKGGEEEQEQEEEKASREQVQHSGSPQAKRPRTLASPSPSNPLLELRAEEGSEGPGSPQHERPRRQGDARFDPLAERLDPEAPRGTRCPRHDGGILRPACRLGNCALERPCAQGGSHADPDPAATPADPEVADLGYEYVLVEEEEHDEDRDEDRDVPTAVRRVCRVNPFRLMEYLQLSREEAFFLVYALGCLSVFHDQEPLSVTQLWGRFLCVQPHFDSSYAAYHFYRSKGWVPKPGIKYGSDLVLYRKGPPFYHASYSVVIDRVDDAFGSGSSGGVALRPFTWRSLAALSRVTGNVSKELLICYVIYPADLSEAELAIPCCLARFKVQELVVSRWISSRERTEQDDI